MPRLNGTGPMGMGAMTGRAQGRCTGSVQPGEVNPGCGCGMGRGRGFGGGGSRGFLAGKGPRGMGFRRMGNQDPSQEQETLKLQAKALESQLTSIKQRLGEFEPENGGK